MSNVSENQNLKISGGFRPAIGRSGDLRLPTRFKQLNQQYMQGEFAFEPVVEAVEPLYIEMSDHAMYPTIAVGAQLIVDSEVLPKHNDIVVANYYGQTICRRIFMSKRKNWLFSDDKAFKFIDLSGNNEVEILGVVTSHFMNHNVA